MSPASECSLRWPQGQPPRQSHGRRIGKPPGALTMGQGEKRWLTPVSPQNFLPFMLAGYYMSRFRHGHCSPFCRICCHLDVVNPFAETSIDGERRFRLLLSQ